jgi:hypothetical protein
MYTPDSFKSYDLFWHNAAECKRLYEFMQFSTRKLAASFVTEDESVVFDYKSVLH